MVTSLADRLNAARHRYFVGRQTELELFESALTTAELSVHILYVYGPGGIGKSSLLREYALSAARHEIPAAYLDARNIEPVPDSFLHTLGLALGLTPGDSPLQWLASRPRRSVILIDTYETLAPLENWLRDVFVPQLPENTLLVLAGRNPLPDAWKADPGWQALIRTVPLRNLSPEASRTFLSRREVPADQHVKILEFTHGHALALSLVADVLAQRHETRFEPEAAPDVIQSLLERFVQKVPGPAHRAALEACALVRVTTQPLLAQMLGPAGGAEGHGNTLPAGAAYELFEWLRGLSFVEAGREGLFPHDLAREALLADLHWRNPDWYAELHRRARDYYLARTQQTRGLEQQRILLDYVFLHRDNPAIRPMLEWQPPGGILADALREPDHTALLDLVAAFEGPESAALASHWLKRQPEAFTVYRDEQGGLAGFIAMLALQRASAQDLEPDPGTFLAWDYIQHHAPLRPGEVAAHYRFWMARDTYQAVSPVQTMIFLNTVRYQLTTSGLAYHFLPCADPDFWAPAFAYANLSRLRELDFEVGARHYGVYAHDWRLEPPLAWLALLAEREVSAAPVAPPRAPTPALIVLSETEFEQAVQEALRHYARAGGLAGNPLLRSRLVMDVAGPHAGETEREKALQSILREATESLQSSPREVKLYRALWHTYFRPEPTQERAAEVLDVPFSTYRRHLKAGLAQVTAALWQREIGAAEK